jgi:hypothetical protein
MGAEKAGKRLFKGQVYDALVAAGIEKEKAHSIANGGKKTAKRSIYQAEKARLSCALLRPSRIKAAEQVIDETMAMIPITVGDKTVIPTISNRLEAADKVLIRKYPVHQVHEHHTIADLSPFDMEKYEMIPKGKVIDQAPTEANSESNQCDTV